MRTRDPDAKRQRLLAGALAEFAEFGVAGARVDRLAKRAGVSAGMVYAYFDNKNGLFEAVFDLLIEQTVAGVPITATDLGEYAGRLYDAGEANPDAIRFIAWYQLERGQAAGTRAATSAAMAEKVAAITAAQRAGLVTTQFTAGQVLALVLALATMWQRQDGDYLALVRKNTQRRATIVDAVRRIVAP
jgi:AcrR family transcriptional regulator